MVPMQLFLFGDGTVSRLLCPWARRGHKLSWKSSVRSTKQEFFKHSLCISTNTECLLHAKIFLGVGGKKIKDESLFPKGVKEAGNTIQERIK